MFGQTKTNSNLNSIGSHFLNVENTHTAEKPANFFMELIRKVINTNPIYSNTALDTIFDYIAELYKSLNNPNYEYNENSIKDSNGRNIVFLNFMFSGLFLILLNNMFSSYNQQINFLGNSFLCLCLCLSPIVWFQNNIAVLQNKLALSNLRIFINSLVNSSLLLVLVFNSIFLIHPFWLEGMNSNIGFIVILSLLCSIYSVALNVIQLNYYEIKESRLRIKSKFFKYSLITFCLLFLTQAKPIVSHITEHLICSNSNLSNLALNYARNYNIAEEIYKNYFIRSYTSYDKYCINPELAYFKITGHDLNCQDQIHQAQIQNDFYYLGKNSNTPLSIKESNLKINLNPESSTANIQMNINIQPISDQEQKIFIGLPVNSRIYSILAKNTNSDGDLKIYNLQNSIAQINFNPSYSTRKEINLTLEIIAPITVEDLKHGFLYLPHIMNPQYGKNFNQSVYIIAGKDVTFDSSKYKYLNNNDENKNVFKLSHINQNFTNSNIKINFQYPFSLTSKYAVNYGNNRNIAPYLEQRIFSYFLEKPRHLSIIIDGSTNFQGYFKDLTQTFKLIPNNIPIDFYIVNSDSAVQKLDQVTATKVLNNYHTDQNYVNEATLKEVIKSSSKEKNSAILWLHGCQPNFNTTIDTATLAFRPNIFELSANHDNICQNFLNQDKTMPYAIIDFENSLISELKDFFNFSLNGQKSWSVSYNEVYEKMLNSQDTLNSEQSLQVTNLFYGKKDNSAYYDNTSHLYIPWNPKEYFQPLYSKNAYINDLANSIKNEWKPNIKSNNNEVVKAKIILGKSGQLLSLKLIKKSMSIQLNDSIETTIIKTILEESGQENNTYFAKSNENHTFNMNFYIKSGAIENIYID